MDETPQDIAKAVAAIGRIDAVPTLLAVLCETTGMRFAVVARVTGKMRYVVMAVERDLRVVGAGLDDRVAGLVESVQNVHCAFPSVGLGGGPGKEIVLPVQKATELARCSSAEAWTAVRMRLHARSSRSCHPAPHSGDAWATPGLSGNG